MTFAYHRLFRSLPSYRWWKPLAAAGVGFALYLLLSNAWALIVVQVVTATSGRPAALALVTAWTKDQQNASNPLVLLLTLGSLAMLLPAVIVAVRLFGLGSWGQLTSVAGRFRWRWLARCLLPGAAYLGVLLGLGALVPASWQGADAQTGSPTPLPALIVSLALIVILVPLQAAGEEFAFRGLGMQALGSWFRWPLVAIVVPTVGFAFAHDYNVWGKLDVGALGVSFAYLTWRTGGLEAAVVAHVLNNVVVFALAAPVVTSTQADGSPIAAAISIISSAVYVVLVTLQARRHRPARSAAATGVVDDAPAVHSSESGDPGVGGAS